MEREELSGKRDDTSRLKRQILIDRIKQHGEALRDNLVEQVEQTLTNLTDELDKLDRPQNVSSPIEKETTKQEKLRDKLFIARSSPLTELLEINHFQTIQHIFVAILLILYLRTLLGEYLNSGSFDLRFELLTWNFGQTGTLFLIWSSMKLSTAILVYVGFHYWIKYRSTYSTIWDWSCLSGYIIYLCSFIYYPAHYIVAFDLPPGSSIILLCEQIRLLMKTHAFVRHNIKKALSVEYSEKDKTTYHVPDFSKYLYFLFVPTLIYRDSYPRNAHIRWGFVVKNILQFVGCMFYIYFVITRYYTVFSDFGLPGTSNPTKYIMGVMDAMLPGAVLYVCNFFGVLQSWFNLFAEILTFADRQFYKDWWNSTSYSTYYRTWNTVVHDWLYAYVYKDISELMPGNKFVPMMAVFIVSAVVHEYILSFMLKFFFPLLFIMFGGFGMGFSFLPNMGHQRNGNVFFWFTLIVGFGLMLSIYSMEWYARRNCEPYSSNYLVDFVIPRMWVCYRKT